MVKKIVLKNRSQTRKKSNTKRKSRKRSNKKKVSRRISNKKKVSRKRSNKNIRSRRTSNTKRNSRRLSRRRSRKRSNTKKRSKKVVKKISKRRRSRNKLKGGGHLLGRMLADGRATLRSRANSPDRGKKNRFIGAVNKAKSAVSDKLKHRTYHQRLTKILKSLPENVQARSFEVSDSPDISNLYCDKNIGLDSDGLVSTGAKVIKCSELKGLQNTLDHVNTVIEDYYHPNNFPLDNVMSYMEGFYGLNSEWTFQELTTENLEHKYGFSGDLSGFFVSDKSTEDKKTCITRMRLGTWLARVIRKKKINGMTQLLKDRNTAKLFVKLEEYMWLLDSERLLRFRAGTDWITDDYKRWLAPYYDSNLVNPPTKKKLTPPPNVHQDYDFPDEAVTLGPGEKQKKEAKERLKKKLAKQANRRAAADAAHSTPSRGATQVTPPSGWRAGSAAGWIPTRSTSMATDAAAISPTVTPPAAASPKQPINYRFTDKGLGWGKPPIKNVGDKESPGHCEEQPHMVDNKRKQCNKFAGTSKENTKALIQCRNPGPLLRTDDTKCNEKGASGFGALRFVEEIEEPVENVDKTRVE